MEITKQNLKDFIKDIKVSQLNINPPFGVLYGDKNKKLNERYGGDRIETQYDNDEFNRDYQQMFNNIFNQITFADYNTIYIWCADRQLLQIFQSLKDSNIKLGQILIWLKNNHILSTMGSDYAYKNEFIIYAWKNKHKFYGGFETTIWEIDRPLSNKLHPTTKPIEVITISIKNGTQENEIILDCFAWFRFNINSM